MSKATYYVQECPTCGRRLRVRVEYLGRNVACQHCSGYFLAQDPASGEPAPADSGIYLLQRAEQLLASSTGASASSGSSSGALATGDSGQNLLGSRWAIR